MRTDVSTAGVSFEVDPIVAGLGRDGAVVVEGVIAPEELAVMRAEVARLLDSTPSGRTDFEGHRTKRVYGLFAKTRAFDRWATHTVMLRVLDATIGPAQLSGPTGIQIGPGECAQVLHRDDSVYPLPEPHAEVVLSTMWALDDFTLDNGATCFVPGSHRFDPGRRPTADDRVAQAVMPAGSVAFYTGSLWHGGGANRTDTPRLGVILEYVAAWLRPQENHLIGVAPELMATLPEVLQELLGYNLYPPFLGYVDGRHPKRYLPYAQRPVPS